MKIKFIKNYTVELPDGTAGLFRAGMEADLNNDDAKIIIKNGYAIRKR